jgi:hypothetical protein
MFQFSPCLAGRTEGKTAKGDDLTGVPAGAVQQVFISLPAEPRIFPGKPADDTSINAVTIHGLKEILKGSDAGLFVFVDQPETLVPTAESLAVLSDLMREEMGMNVNNHGAAGGREEGWPRWKELRSVEEMGNSW